jgi:predicted RNA-binding protein with PIN domain
MATAKTQAAPSPTLRAYQDKISAQVQESKARLQQLEAKAKEKKAQADIATIDTLNTAQEYIDRKVADLKTTHAANISRAKADIDADVATFKASVDRLTASFKGQSSKK